MKNKLAFAELAISLIGLIQKMIPAFLVAWNGYLRNKNAKLEAKVTIMREDKRLKKELEKIHEKYEKEDPISVIDNYLLSRELKRSNWQDTKTK